MRLMAFLLSLIGVRREPRYFYRWRWKESSGTFYAGKKIVSQPIEEPRS